MISLVGYTGFVGSNIYDVGKAEIDKVYNSKNIEEAYETAPDILIYAGMRAEKYLANTAPDADMQLIYQAEENIRKIAPKKLILISTIDVFNDSDGKDETSNINTENLHPYGFNRYLLEQWVRQEYSDALIIRLPGLYGKNIKKNFIYDYINVIPHMLKKDKFEELFLRDNQLSEYYELLENGFYRCRELLPEEKLILKKIFKTIGFTALNFTDSRSIYQFYPLSRLWDDIKVAVEKKITTLHLATNPVSVREVYQYLTGDCFVNEIASKPVFYNYRTIHDTVFGGSGGYLMSKKQVLEDIRKFIGGYI